ncbi:MAG: DUF3310 domain-containing protein [Bacteroidota bacterium]
MLLYCPKCGKRFAREKGVTDVKRSTVYCSYTCKRDANQPQCAKAGEGRGEDECVLDGKVYCSADCAADVLEMESKDLNRKDPKSRYYDQGGLEVLDIIQAKLTPEQWKGYLLGNLIKYTCRANWKGDFERDAEKIEFYGNYLKGDK